VNGFVNKHAELCIMKYVGVLKKEIINIRKMLLIEIVLHRDEICTTCRQFRSKIFTHSSYRIHF
jgi:hypothetical protein